MKSLLLSLLLTGFVFFSFMSLIDQNTQSWLNKIPTWTAYPVIIILAIAYLTALYWGVTGIIQEQRLANGFGILLSLLGIGLFLVGFTMELGKNKEKVGQFDHQLTPENINDINALQAILEQAKLSKNDIKLLTYWDLPQSEAKLAVCIQKGHIIGISLKNVALTDVSYLSNLPALASVTINKCKLKNIKNLRLLRADRLNLNNNLLENLTGIEAPNVKWLDVENNNLSSLIGIENLPQAQYFNFAGNTITDFSAAKKHSFLNHLAIKR
jgi:hypothetical protein